MIVRINIAFFSFLPFLEMAGKPDLEFFENRIRPVLAENCYECHNSIKQAKSGLVLDYKNGILKGGERGPAISLTNPKSSLLLRVMKHEINNLKMPKGGPKITNKIIQDFESWISKEPLTHEICHQPQNSLHKRHHGKKFVKKEKNGGAFSL